MLQSYEYTSRNRCESGWTFSMHHMWLEYHPQVVSYARGDIGQAFATTYRLPTPKHAPFAIGYAFEGKPHDYLPDVVGTLRSGKLRVPAPK